MHIPSFGLSCVVFVSVFRCYHRDLHHDGTTDDDIMTTPTLQTVMEELERSEPTTPCSTSSSSSALSSPCKGWTRSSSRILRPGFLQLGNPQIASCGRTTSRRRRRRHNPSRSSSPVFRLFKSVKVP